MAIIFHCNHCGKKMEASDSAGGKWGRCPACHNKVYVPRADLDEELKLAPVDESEEERRKQLMAETNKLTQDILQEREMPVNGAAEAVEQPIIMNEKELTKNIIMHLRLMADGELEEAQRLANLTAPYGQRAVEIIDRIALSEIPEPELADIPQQVLAGLIRTLRSKII
jgi:DNA-directed RNA polymerase subunit RPC12/RpoP